MATLDSNTIQFHNQVQSKFNAQNKQFESFGNRLNYIEEQLVTLNQYLPMLLNFQQGKLPDAGVNSLFSYLNTLFHNFKTSQINLPLNGISMPGQAMGENINKVTAKSNSPIGNSKPVQSPKKPNSNKRQTKQLDEQFEKIVDNQRETYRKLNNQSIQSQSIRERSGQSFQSSGQEQSRERTKQIVELLRKQSITSNNSKKSIKSLQHTKTNPSIKRINVVCPICDDYISECVIIAQCKHQFCKSCLLNNLQIQLNRGTIKLNCPCCFTKLSQQMLELTYNVRTTQSLMKNLISNQIKQLQPMKKMTFIRCSKATCEYFCVNAPTNNKRNTYCPICHAFTVNN